MNAKRINYLLWHILGVFAFSIMPVVVYANEESVLKDPIIQAPEKAEQITSETSKNFFHHNFDGTVKSLVSACQFVAIARLKNEQLSDVSKDAIATGSYCLGFIHYSMGTLSLISEGVNKSCKNKIHSLNQDDFIDIFLNYSKNNQIDDSLPAALLMHLALSDSLPCIEK